MSAGIAPSLAVATCVLVLGGCAASSPLEAPQAVSDGRYSMGTVLEMTLLGAEAPEARRRLEAAFGEVAELEALLSRYDAQSQISRLNRAAGSGETVALDPRVAALVERSVAYESITRGSFDVTIGPLVALWTEAAERGLLPTESQLAAARTLVDASRLRVEAGGRALLPRAGMSVDLGGIAKGYALDRVAAALRESGVAAALLSFGQSSGWAIGAPPDAPDGWRLLLRAPGGGFAGVVTLRDRAYSVSSSLGQWSEIDGRRYGHVIDPRSGWPITQGVEAAVVAADATTAEALSTAVVVLGHEEGLEVVESLPGAEALLVDEAGRRWKSRGWDRATRFSP